MENLENSEDFSNIENKEQMLPYLLQLIYIN
jgi:hypothetical protein